MQTFAPLPAPALEHVFDFFVTVAPMVDAGITSHGHRRMIPITGGRVTLAPALAARYYPDLAPDAAHGSVVPGGADYQLVLDGGSAAHLDARYVVDLHGGARIFVANTALRCATPEISAKLMRGEPVDPADVYFRCQPRFETAAPEWQWLQKFQFIGSARRLPDAVQLSIFKVL